METVIITKSTTVVETRREFAAAVKYAYSIDPLGPAGQELRTTVVGISAEHAQYLSRKEHEVFAKLMEDVAEFGKDLSKELVSRSYPGLDETKTESKEESDDDMGFGLFD